MNLKLDIKTSDVLKKAKEDVLENLKKDVKAAAEKLGKSAYKEAQKISKEKLPGSLNSIYQENLYIEQISENITVIGIREEALWIEEGRKSGFMHELLQGPNVKTSKEGNKYRVIPFNHDTSKKASSGSGSELVAELKTFLKSKSQPYSKTRNLATDSQGSPRIGKIASYSIKDMGKKGVSKNLQGLSVYQNKNEKTGKVERNIMTFRVISEKHKSEGKWNHPGRPAEKILEQTFEFVQKSWQQEILPVLKEKYGK